MNAQKLKLHCMNLALQTLGTPSSAEAVLAAAKKFEAYVGGNVESGHLTSFGYSTKQDA